MAAPTRALVVLLLVPLAARVWGEGADSRNGAATDFILLGDSWAEGANQYLADNCPGKTVVNRGVGGSTAVEWGTGVETTDKCKAKPASCSAASAFSATFGKGYSKAWLSVGGNDYLWSNCNSASKDAIVENVKATITSVLAAATTPGFTILVTGYGAASSGMDIIPDCKATSMALLKQAIQEAVAASPAGKVTFVDVLSTFGGSATTYSAAKWYADPIHLNKAGYDKMFQLPAVQSFFGCDNTNGASQAQRPAVAALLSVLGAGVLLLSVR